MSCSPFRWDRASDWRSSAPSCGDVMRAPAICGLRDPPVPRRVRNRSALAQVRSLCSAQIARFDGFAQGFDFTLRSLPGFRKRQLSRPFVAREQAAVG
jgi:hypothetical protein